MTQHISSSDYQFRFKDSIVGAQMMFVAFGALVLVPLLTGLDPNVALFTAGAGTLIFQVVTKRMVPIFLASSFAFIAPIIYGVKTWGIPGTLCGLAAAGVLYMILSACIKAFGAGFLHRVLPPVVIGPVIMVIGLVLAPVAVFMAVGKNRRRRRGAGAPQHGPDRLDDHPGHHHVRLAAGQGDAAADSHPVRHRGGICGFDSASGSSI